MAQIETLDTFENNRAAAIEVVIFSDTNVRMSVGMHLHVLPGMHVSMCAQAASLIIFHYYVQYNTLIFPYVHCYVCCYAFLILWLHVF